jgi:hypothetical protein
LEELCTTYEEPAGGFWKGTAQGKFMELELDKDSPDSDNIY